MATIVDGKMRSGELKDNDQVVVDIEAAGEGIFAKKSEVDADIQRIDTALDGKQNTLTFDNTPTAGSQNPVTSDGIKQAIDAATPSDYDTVKAQVQQNTTDIGTNTQAITGINSKIPAQASAQNQLADKAFVNSSIQTNTATFRGTYNLVTDLGLTVSATEEQVAAAIATHLASLVPPIVPENNDYVFVQIPRETSDPTIVVRYDRYKCTVEEVGSVVTRTWSFEFSLNNSSFTADQWAAINSGITSGLVAKLGALPTAQELAAALLAKYEKPLTGIPKSDLASGVQTSLDKADTALQTAPVTSVNSKTGAVVLSASDVGALGNSGDQTLDGGLTLGDGSSEKTLWFDALTGKLGITNIGGYDNVLNALWKWPTHTGVINNTLALLADIYAAVQQIAPAFTAKIYTMDDLCSYNGVVYRCKSAYTATAQSTKPSSDTTHWEAKKVSELFLPLTGGDMTGVLTVPMLSVGQFYHAITTAEDFDGTYVTICGIWNFENLSGSRITRNIGMEIKSVAFLEDTMRFSSEASYAVGDVVFYNGAFYRCTTANTAGAWNASYFAEVIGGLSTGTPTAPTPTAGDDSTKIATTEFVQGEVGGKANSAAIAPEFSSSSTYAVGDVVMHGGLRYKCSTAVSTAGEWNSANWTLEPVQTALGNITPGPDNTKANSTAIAPAFDNTSAYTAGKYVTYNGNCYCAVVDVPTPASGSTNPTPDQDIYDGTTTPATGHWELKDINSRLVPIEVLLGVEAALSVINSGTEQIETLDERLTAAETAIYNILHGASN